MSLLKKILIAIAVFLLSLNNVYAQVEKVVQGEYVYVIPENESRAEAKKVAISLARKQAIADEFGTTISQNNFTRIRNVNSKTDTRFLALMNSVENGVWVKDIAPPKTKIVSNNETEEQVVYAYVHGIVRELVSHKTDLALRILKNETNERSETDVFKSGDTLYMSLRSPIDGYVAVYLVDEADSVFCLLPYHGMKDGRVPIIKADQDYVFFSRDKEHIQSPFEEKDVKRLILLTNKKEEFNTIYVVFSQKPFVKANAEDAGREIDALELPRYVSFKKFHEWLSNNLLSDKTMQVEERIIRILSGNN